MNLRQIIRDTQAYNFHNHTEYCDGRNTVEAMAYGAEKAGMKHFGFTPHSPIPIDSPCNMSKESVPRYRAEVERMKTLGLPVRFYTGMEIDYLGSQWGPANDYFSDLGLDFCIGSVHFIPNQKGEYVDIDGHFDSFQRKMADKFGGDIHYVVTKFYEQSAAMLAAGGFDILGHFDKVGHNAALFQPGIEDEPWYQDIIGDFINLVVDSKVLVEINTKARAEHGRFFPGERYWKRLIDAGVDFIVNSDAHYADRISSSRAEALELLKGYGYDL